MKTTIAAALILLGLGLLKGHAAFSTETATDAVRAMLNEVVAIQNDPRMEGRESRNTRRDLIKKIIVRNFDFDDMAKNALGPEQWNKLGQGQRSEFKTVFQDLFLDSYSRLVLDFVRNEKIEYRGQDSGQEKTIVRTLIYRLDDRIPVDYQSRLRVGAGTWLVCDVTIDGVSIVGTYRVSFSRVIKEDSFDGLLKRMRLQQKAEQG